MFGLRDRLTIKSALDISCKGTSIQAKDQVKYFGAVLEQCLSGENMLTSIIQEANIRLKFYIKTMILNFTTKQLLVMSLIHCHFAYKCCYWYPCLSKNLKNRLQVTQNKIIRFVLQMDPRRHVSSDSFRSQGRLPISKRVEQIILNHVFKIKSGLSPDYMLEHFIPASSVHAYGTRFRDTESFTIPKVKGFGKKYFAYILWNTLPTDIRSIQRHKAFKLAVKSHFLHVTDI